MQEYCMYWKMKIYGKIAIKIRRNIMDMNEMKAKLCKQSIDRIDSMLVMSNPDARGALSQVMEMTFEAGWEAALTMATSLPAVELIDLLREKKKIEG